MFVTIFGVFKKYFNEPVRSPKLSVLNERPFDAETPKFLLGRHFFVPNDLFYVRNHFPVPSIDEEEYALRISLPKEWESHVHEKQFNPSQDIYICTFSYKIEPKCFT